MNSLLHQFLETGELYDLKLGLSLREVLEYLGLPFNTELSIDQYIEAIDMKTAPSQYYHALGYGCLQVGFWRNEWKLSTIKIDFLNRNFSAVPRVYGEILQSEIASLNNFDVFQAFITKHRLKCCKLILPSVVGKYLFSVTCAPSNVIIHFEWGNDKIGKLLNITKHDMLKTPCEELSCEEFP